MKTLTLVIAAFLCFNINAFAQDAPPADTTYAHKADEIQKKIWGEKVPEFEVKTLPASMDKESAVIIARSLNVELSSNNKLKMVIFSSSTTRTNKVSTFRERVKINDKSSLDAFSTLEYQKSLDRTKGGFLTKYVNKKDTYIGAKIIKPSGQEIMINTGEEVLTKNESRDKQGQLAIPGLQVGDILDYYICKIELVENNGDEDLTKQQKDENEYAFILADEYPVLSYNINFKFNSKINVYYINANKAPDFKITTEANGDKTYNVQLKDIPKYVDKLWSEPFRQYPYIRISSSYGDKFLNLLAAGQLFTYDKNAAKIINAVKSYEAQLAYQGTDPVPEKLLKRQFGKEVKENPRDTLMKFLYDALKYRAFCYYDGQNLDVTSKRGRGTARSLYCIAQLSHMLYNLNIEHEILLVAPRNSGSLDNFFSKGDVEAMIRVKGDKDVYMAFDDVFTQYNEIPANYQGEEAFLLLPQNHAYTAFTESRTKIAVVEASKNYVKTIMNVSLVPTNMQKVKIQRTVTEGGFMRHGDQQNLVLMQNIDETYTDMLGGDDLTKRLPKGVNAEKLSTEYQDAFEKAKEDLPDNFKAEIVDEFDQEPQEFKDFKVNSNGLTGIDPVFSYSGTFVMNNYVKKAGNNYVFEAGKFISTFNKADEKERTRKIDIYMPAARTLTYVINFTIPAGYRVKGAEDLSHNQNNETGTFSVGATVKGNILSIQVNRIYTHNFEKVENWPKLLEIMDSFSDFTNQKVLLEKI